MAPGARFTVPAARPGVQRALYFFVGSSLRVDDQKLPVMTCARVQGDAEIPLVNGPEPGEILLLEGRPIGEPVVHYGPFVMNTADEIRDAFADYQRTRFGGWPWPAAGPTHPRDSERFAVHADGTRDTPV